MSSMRASILSGVGGVVVCAVLGLWPGYAAAAGPDCAPAQLENSALLDGAVTVSPLPGSRDATPDTQLSMVGLPPGDLRIQSVTGSLTGTHRGRLESYSQGDGASFVPSRPFAPGERVTMHALVRLGGAERPLADTFAIARLDPLRAQPEAVHPGGPADQQAFRSRPELHPPEVTVTADAPPASDGDVFVAPYSGPGQAGPMILDSSGALVWFHPLPPHVSATNFRVQELDGAPVLTWWEGVISVHGFGEGEDIVADQAYEALDRVSAGNGLRADLHEFQLTSRGTALITAYEPVMCDLAAVGGPVDGAVTDGVLQEVDVRTGLVRMQWTSLDHVALGESYEHPGGAASWPYDYFHINSIDVDPDGTLLVSARNTWTVYDLDTRSGRVLWRLGGHRSSYTEPAQARTAWQHDPRVLADGSISIFDNGSSPTVHAQSRAIVLRLEPHGAVSLVSQLTHTPGLIAESQGNVQELPGGDWFVGWGQVPDFSEFSAAGELLFDAHLPARDQSYRSFRYPWSGTPAHQPAVAFQPLPGAGGTAYASWNGATQVSAWRLLAGTGASALDGVTQAARTGFETALELPPGTGTRVLAVQALDATGAVLATSAPLAVAPT